MAEPLTSTAWVYGLEDPDGNLCYAGSTRSYPPRRLTSHQKGCRSDPLRSPLTRCKGPRSEMDVSAHGSRRTHGRPCRWQEGKAQAGWWSSERVDAHILRDLWAIFFASRRWRAASAATAALLGPFFLPLATITLGPVSFLASFAKVSGVSN